MISEKKKDTYIDAKFDVESISSIKTTVFQRYLDETCDTSPCQCSCPESGQLGSHDIFFNFKPVWAAS